MITVALDGMGGDNAPVEPVKAAVSAIKLKDDLRILLVGQEEVLNKELSSYSYDANRIRVVPASEVIATDEPPVLAIRKKKDSSMVVALNLLKNKEADALVSSGNSGALLVGAQLFAGRLPSVKRAPFAPLIPTEKGVSLLLDAGANVDARPEHLVMFARMGTIYMRDVMGIENPRVGIVNIGAEEEKGNALVKETFPLLKACEDIHFIGSVEARDIPSGYADVIVCEGFVGNVVLKMYEGVASTLLGVLKKAFKTNLRSKIGALLALPYIKGTLKEYDATEYGGAPMLGLHNLVVKTHGNAKEKELKNAIMQCVAFREARIAEKIEQNLTSNEELNSQSNSE